MLFNDKVDSLPSLLQSVPSRNPNEVKCNCYVSAVYSAKKGLAMEHLRDFEPRVLDYYGPTLLPAFFILFCLIIALFYCYWAFFQDVQEMECVSLRYIYCFLLAFSIEHGYQTKGFGSIGPVILAYLYIRTKQIHHQKWLASISSYCLSLELVPDRANNN